MHFDLLDARAHELGIDIDVQPQAQRQPPTSSERQHQVMPPK